MGKTKEDAINDAAWFMEKYGDTYCALKLLYDAAEGIDDSDVLSVQNDVLERISDDKARSSMKALFQLLFYYRDKMKNATDSRK